MHLQVAPPILIKDSIRDYHTYPISGTDSDGQPVECQRRYNLFYEFREVLLCKFPGLYVPPLSPKQVTGKGAEFTLLERQFFLDQFLKQCCKLTYIARSAELTVFLKAEVDLAKELSKLQVRIKTTDQISLYRTMLQINEGYQERELKIFLEDTLEFIKD